MLITATASPSPVVSGQELTYTITVTNSGGAKVSEVNVTDQVNGLTGVDGTSTLVLTSSRGSCTQTNGLVTCSTKTMPGFSTWTITIRGRVTAAGGTVLNNTATVTATKSATTFTNSATVSVQVDPATPPAPKPDLTVSINAPSRMEAGAAGNGIFTVTVNNTGTEAANDIRVVTTLPSDFDLLGTAPGPVHSTSLFACTVAVSTITCDGGRLNAGSNATISIYVDGTGAAGTKTVTAAVDPLNTVPELIENNNDAQAIVKVGMAAEGNDLTIAKSDSVDPVAWYGTLTYTLVVTNTSSRDRADYVQVVDGTQGLEAASITASAAVTSGSTGTVPTCTVVAPSITCDWTRMAAGAVVTITISGTVIAPAGTVIINTATVNGNIRNTGYTSTDTEFTTVRPTYDFTVTQVLREPAVIDQYAVPPARAGSRFDYLITVGNSGLEDGQPLVYEQLPAGVKLDGFVDVDGAGFTCTGVGTFGPAVACTGGTVPGIDALYPGGQTRQILLELIAPQATGPITSTVVVDPNNAIAESDESNNSFTTTTQVATGIDLTLDKVDNADGSDRIPRNGTLRYTITVSNIGTQDAYDILVRDTLPAGTTFRSVAMSGDPHDFTCVETAPASGVVECSGGDLLGEYSGSETRPTDFATIVIEVFAPDTPGVIENEVAVDPDLAIAEVDEANNIDSESTLVVNGLVDGNTWIDLDIAQAGGSDGIVDNFDPIATSGTLDYTVTVRNQGVAAAYNVVVRAELPAGSTFRSASDLTGAPGAFTCAEAGGFVTCSGGTLGASSTRNLRISTFAPPAPGQALLEVIVDPDNAIPEADESDNQANETTDVVAGGPGAFLELHVFDITDSFDPVAPSGYLTYAVTIRNQGSGDAFGASFRATLPTGSIFRAADDVTPPAPPNPDAFSCTQAGGVVTCTGARINAGASRVVNISVFAPAIPGAYRLDVLVDPANAIPEGHEGNNSAEEYTSVLLGGGGGFINLSLTKADTPDPVTPGGQITYTLTVSNDGTDDAFNVKARDVLPAGVGFVSAVGTDGFVCLAAGGVVDCSGGYVKGKNNNGGSPGQAVISIVVTAPLAHGVTITNQAFVDPFNEIAEASEIDNSATTTTKVESKIDLQPTGITGYPGVNNEGTVTFTVKNNGTAAASGVLVVANLPIGVIPLDVDASTTSWSCAAYENPINQVVCTGSLGAGATDTFTVRVFRTSDDPLNSSVTVDPNNTIVEYDETNNTAS